MKGVIAYRTEIGMQSDVPDHTQMWCLPAFSHWLLFWIWSCNLSSMGPFTWNMDSDSLLKNSFFRSFLKWMKLIQGAKKKHKLPNDPSTEIKSQCTKMLFNTWHVIMRLLKPHAEIIFECCKSPFPQSNKNEFSTTHEVLFLGFLILVKFPNHIISSLLLLIVFEIPHKWVLKHHQWARGRTFEAEWQLGSWEPCESTQSTTF